MSAYNPLTVVTNGVLLCSVISVITGNTVRVESIPECPRRCGASFTDYKLACRISSYVVTNEAFDGPSYCDGLVPGATHRVLKSGEHFCSWTSDQASNRAMGCGSLPSPGTG